MRNAGLPRLLRVFFLASALAATAAAADPKGRVVETAEGPVRGVRTGAVDTFLGIPYAAAPVGDLRWRPPQPHPRWKGVRDAGAFASHCPQGPSPFGLASATEDCLFLNVFTPAHGDGARDDEEGDDDEDGRLPVMVWIHGGALLVGESDDYDPARLVKQGVVVVTVNYRLGVLGFLAHPALTAESPDHASGNYGLMDQQAALRWVQRNIARFGGDPRRVTLFGESAGGLSVHSQLASPLAAGLFHRAIVESGAYALNQPSLAQAEALGTAVSGLAGCTDQSAACLRAAPVATLLAALAATRTATVIPDVDGKVLTQTVAAAFTSGQFNRMPVIEGSNHDEWRLFVALNIELVTGPLLPAQYTGAIAATLGVPLATAAALGSFYPLVAFPSPGLALSALGTDAIFACNSRKAARLMSPLVPTYAYEFNDENAPQLFLPPVSFPYGAAHASEIQYLFDLRSVVPAPPLTADQQRLSAAMVAYWTNFARTGNPNWLGTPLWPRYDRTSDTIQSLAPPTSAVETRFATDHKCAIWAPSP
ncbi:MAG TPA: carboxylesterase family protein [Myxococcales bacterium]|nr:carboxylesterase family protein [Myxococcales bacterium]